MERIVSLNNDTEYSKNLRMPLYVQGADKG